MSEEGKKLNVDRHRITQEGRDFDTYRAPARKREREREKGIPAGSKKEKGEYK